MAVYLTGDKHGDFSPDHDDYAKVKRFCEENRTTKDDVMIVLGDHGTRFFPNRDAKTQHALKKLANLPITFVLLRGNHDRRVGIHTPNFTELLVKNDTMSGVFFIDKRYPSIYYTDEYGEYTFARHPALVICGAYSVDKDLRLAQEQFGLVDYPTWFPNEQLSEAERAYTFRLFKAIANDPERKTPLIILSHTCPMQVRPTECLLPGIPADSVDTTMEQWMDTIASYRTKEGEKCWDKWYCGHWHTDKTVGDYRFLYHDIIELPPAKGAAT